MNNGFGCSLLFNFKNFVYAMLQYNTNSSVQPVFTSYALFFVIRNFHLYHQAMLEIRAITTLRFASLNYSFYQQFLNIPCNSIVQELSSFMTRGENYCLTMICRLFVTVLELFGIGCAALVALGIIILVIVWVCGRTCCSSDSRRRRRQERVLISKALVLNSLLTDVFLLLSQK